MSLRALPDIQIALPKAEISFDLAPQAVASWDSAVMAADDHEDVISILDPIGESYDGRGVTANRIGAALRTIGAKPATVQINSPGGNFFEGLAIYNMLRQHPYQVTVQVIGIAASAAAIIAMAGDQIEIAKAGLMMIHNTQWIAVGDRHAMKEAHDTMAIFDEACVDLFVDRTAESAKDVAAMMDATTFLSGKKAVELGFADQFLDADRVPTAVRAASEMSPIYKIEAAMARAGVPRAERRRLVKDLTGMPSAADDADTPGAVDPAIGLSLALAHLKLKRA